MQSTENSAAVSNAPKPQGSQAGGSRSLIQGSDAFSRLISGSDSSQMNLRAVKERCSVLQSSLKDFIGVLQYRPHLLNWNDALERFGVLSVQHQQLMDQLRPLLKFYVAHPKAVNQTNAELLPLVLSTMKLPEIESEENRMLEKTNADVSNKGVSRCYQELGDSLESLNKVANSAVNHDPASPESGLLNPKSMRRKSMTQKLRAAVNLAEVRSMKVNGPKVADEDAKALLAAAARGQGL